MLRSDILRRVSRLQIGEGEQRTRELLDWIQSAPEDDLQAFRDELEAFGQRLGLPLRTDALQGDDPEETLRASSLGYFAVAIMGAYKLQSSGTGDT